MFFYLYYLIYQLEMMSFDLSGEMGNDKEFRFSPIVGKKQQHSWSNQ